MVLLVREHHVHPERIFQYGFWHDAGMLSWFAFLFAARCSRAAAARGRPRRRYALAAAGAPLEIVFMLEFHKCGHRLRPGRWARGCSACSSCSRRDTMRHHSGRHDDNYCLITGIADRTLGRLGAFRLLERLISRLTAAVPRENDRSGCGATGARHDPLSAAAGGLAAREVELAPVTRLLGILPVEIGEAARACHAPARPTTTRSGPCTAGSCGAGGRGHGVALATLLADDEGFATLEQRMDHLRPLREGRLLATAQWCDAGARPHTSSVRSGNRRAALARASCVCLRHERAVVERGPAGGVFELRPANAPGSCLDVTGVPPPTEPSSRSGSTVAATRGGASTRGGTVSA
jgi:acyl-coenzyme A thioesterase PaaI-like protein